MINIQISTELDAARFWVNRDWSAIPTSLIGRAFRDDMDSLELLAGGSIKSDCHDSDVSYKPDTDEIPGPEHGDTYDTKGDNAAVCESCDRKCETHSAGAEYGYPAAWGTMFKPESMDEDWIRSNLDLVAGCGFLVYESDETGIVLGIDGAGYDFYDAHWIPLYRARGLQWHRPDDAPAPEPTPAPRAKRTRPSKARKPARKVASKPAKRSKRAS